MKGRIRNDGDWFLATICLRNEPASRKSTDDAARHVTWLNTHLIHAKTLSDAYDKAVAIGRIGAGPYKAKSGMWKWRFVGIWDMVPIYDDLADGEELYWFDYGSITARVARRHCITKRAVTKRFAPARQRRTA